MSTVIRVAMTQAVNAYPDMPEKVEDLPRLSSKLEDIRRANVEHHIGLMREGKKHGVAAICFGELFTGPYFALATDAMWIGLAEDAADGATVHELRAAAKELEQIVVAPIYEKDPSGARFNTAVVIDGKGEVLGKYRKTHIPYGTNEQGTFHENFYYDRSDGKNGGGASNVSKNPFFPVFATPIGKIGVAICYDRHFEGVMSTLKAEGAELVFSPAVTFGEKSRRMWHQEFRVDACRHNLFIGGSNRKGSERPWNQLYFGDTYFTGPNGLCNDLSPHAELVITEIDLGELARPDPSGWNLPRDSRADIYKRR